MEFQPITATLAASFEAHRDSVLALGTMETEISKHETARLLAPVTAFPHGAAGTAVSKMKFPKINEQI